MPQAGTNFLAPLVGQIIEAEPGAYRKLIASGGTPATAKAQLANIQPPQLFTVPLTSPVYGYALLAGLWLWRNGLQECHEIVQKSPNDLRHKASDFSQSARLTENDESRDEAETLAFWHAILHRREGDFSNSKYWFARCRNHPAHGVIASSLAETSRGGWDPGTFVDLVEQIHDRPEDPRHATAIEVQRLEWNALLAHCAREATT